MDVLIPHGIVYGTLWVGTGLVIILLAAIFAVRTTRTRRDSHSARVLAPLADDLMAVATGEDPTGVSAARLIAIPRRQRATLERAIVIRLEFLRGAPGLALTDILEAWGVRDKWIRNTRSLSPTKRALAVTDLGLLNDPALTDVVLPRLRDRNVRVRTCALRALGRFQPSQGVPDILDAIAPGHRGGLPPWVALEALTFAGAEIGVRDALSHAVPEVRAVAARIVALTGWSSSASHLRRVMDGETNTHTLVHQTRALGVVGSDGDTALLEGLTLPEKHQKVRVAAIGSLAEVCDDKSPLGDLLSDPDPVVSRSAAATLGRMGATGRQVLSAVPDPSPEARQEMALAALRAPSPRAAITEGIA